MYSEAVKGIDFIMKLRPVTYQLDMAGINKKLNSNGAVKQMISQRKIWTRTGKQFSRDL